MNRIKLKPIAISLMVLVLAVVLVVSIEPEAQPVTPVVNATLPVTVVRVEPQTHQPTLTLTGTTQPCWLSDIRSQVSGRVIKLNTELEPGILVKKGQRLAQLETVHLNSEAAQTLSMMKNAELDLLREKHEQTVAIKMISDRNNSSFARREPQIAAAKAYLSQAKQAYYSAVKRLEDATISAPFDAIIMERKINPSQYVESGEVIFTIAASDSLDVIVPVSELIWNDLSATLSQPQITVVDRQSREWPGFVRYIAPKADPSTRQRQIVLSVRNPYVTRPMLLPDQQVRVQVTLQTQSSTVRLPVSAMTHDGHIWVVDHENKLRLEQVELIEENKEALWVKFAHHPEQVRDVVVYPLQSMLVGQLVSPVAEMENRI